MVGLKLMYAPITQSLVTGLQSREEECGYTTIKVLPETKSDIFKVPCDAQIRWCHHLRWYFEFHDFHEPLPNTDDSQQNLLHLVSGGTQESGPMHRYLHWRIQCVKFGSTPGETLQRRPWYATFRPGFFPPKRMKQLMISLVDEESSKYESCHTAVVLYWVDLARFGRNVGINCSPWNISGNMSWKKIPQGGAKGYPKVYTMEDWRNLGRNLKNVIFLNIHQACNRDQPLETKPLETVRLAQLLSLGFTVISEEANSAGQRALQGHGG